MYILYIHESCIYSIHESEWYVWWGFESCLLYIVYMSHVYTVYMSLSDMCGEASTHISDLGVMSPIYGFAEWYVWWGFHTHIRLWSHVSYIWCLNDMCGEASEVAQGRLYTSWPIHMVICVVRLHMCGEASWWYVWRGFESCLLYIVYMSDVYIVYMSLNDMCGEASEVAQGRSTRVYTRHDSYAWETWFMCIRDMTHVYTKHDSCM